MYLIFIFRHFTLCDGIEKCLKKGSTAEKSAASELASIVCVQLGAEPASEEVCKVLKPILMNTAADNSVNPAVRGKVSVSL